VSKEEGLYSLQEKKRDEYSYEGMTSWITCMN
jgi:hypothetical protein